MDDTWYCHITKELEDLEKEILDVLHSENEELNDMCRHVITAGGKRIRPAICILTYLACGGKNVSRAIDLAAAYEIVHTASLVHDDINDKSEIRRGRKTLHKEYTVSKAIIAGDYMMAKGFRALGVSSGVIVDTIVDAASRMTDSEFIQKEFEHVKNVTIEDYYRIIKGKTSKLIEACAKSGAFLANACEDFVNAIGDYASGIGMAFQIVDDTLDVIGDLGNTGKKVGLDLLEGKPTLPTIIAMSDPVYGKEISSIFVKEEPTMDDVRQALDLIKKTNAVEQCLVRAEEQVEIAIRALAPLKDSVYKASLISLAKYIVDRDR